MNRAIRRMAIEIVEKNRGLDDLMIVGIRSRGVPIGERMAKEIEQMEGQPCPFGILDITLYRDDLTTIAPQPVVKPTKLPEPIDDKIIVLVDDVLYTGRTVRAALDALIDFGRPKRSCWPSSSTAATASSPSTPTSSARPSPPTRRSHQGEAGRDGWGG